MLEFIIHIFVGKKEMVESINWPTAVAIIGVAFAIAWVFVSLN